MRALVLLLLFAAATRGETPVPMQRVGQPLVLTEIYIPGGEAKPAPRRDRQPPLSVRLLDVKPAQDGFRYDFEVQGFEPGPYDLAAFLVAADPAQPPKFPKIPLEIRSGLPAGILLPHELRPAMVPSLGGYRATMLVLGVVWAGGFMLLLYWLRHKPFETLLHETPPSTAADRLRPLVLAASSGQMDSGGRAQLERLIIGYWRERLPEIGALPPAQAMILLRSHSEAAPLLLALEEWLHARRSRATAKDIETLLAPYR